MRNVALLALGVLIFAPFLAPDTALAETPTRQPATQPAEMNGIIAARHDVVYVADASGSMTPKFDTLRLELAKAIESIRQPSKFNVVFFQETTCPEASPDLIDATAEGKARALKFINEVAPRGPTDPIPAIRRAFALKPDIIYLITDGDFPNNDAVIAFIRKLNPDRKVKVNTIAFLDPGEADPKVLRDIAKENGGRFHSLTAKEADK